MAAELEERIEQCRKVFLDAGLTKAQVDAYERKAKELAARYPLAAENAIYWVLGEGGTKSLKPDWLRGWRQVDNAEERIRGYFRDKTFVKRIEELHRKKPLQEGAPVAMKDYWDGSIVAEHPREAYLFFVSGRSFITSHGEFVIVAKRLPRGDFEIEVTGRVDHGWWDTYRWTKGKSFPVQELGRISDEQMQKLKEVGARDYRMESWWSQSVTATVYMDARGRIIPSKTRVQWGKIHYNKDGKKLDRLPGQ